MEYRTYWVEQRLNGPQRPFPCEGIDAALAPLAREGWTLHSMTPGTNASTYGGVFFTVQREEGRSGPLI